MNARVVFRYKMIELNWPVTFSINCSARKCLISLPLGSRLASVIGSVGAVYRV